MHELYRYFIYQKTQIRCMQCWSDKNLCRFEDAFDTLRAFVVLKKAPI